MATTRADIINWFARGMRMGATHMLVVCDTFDYSDYPVYVMPNENVWTKSDENNGPNMTRLMEVYNLSKDMNAQLSERRSFNY